MRVVGKVGIDWRMGSFARVGVGPPTGRGMREVEERRPCCLAVLRILPGVVPAKLGSGDCARGGKASPAKQMYGWVYAQCIRRELERLSDDL